MASALQALVQQLADVGGAHVEVRLVRAGPGGRTVALPDRRPRVARLPPRSSTGRCRDRARPRGRPAASLARRAPARPAGPRPPPSRASPRAPRRRIRAAGPRAAPAGSRRSGCPSTSPGSVATPASASGVPFHGAFATAAPCTCHSSSSRPSPSRLAATRRAVSSRVSGTEPGARRPKPCRSRGMATKRRHGRDVLRHPGMLAAEGDYTKPMAADPSSRTTRRTVSSRARVCIVALEEAEALLASTAVPSSARGSSPSPGRASIPRDGSRHGSPPSAPRSGCWDRARSSARSRSCAGTTARRGCSSREAPAERLAALGASSALVSLTHERRHAAALVLLVREPA